MQFQIFNLITINSHYVLYRDPLIIIFNLNNFYFFKNFSFMNVVFIFIKLIYVRDTLNFKFQLNFFSLIKVKHIMINKKFVLDMHKMCIGYS